MSTESHDRPDQDGVEFVADEELAREVEKLSRPSLRPRDGVLFRQGQSPTCLYYVKSGEVALGMESGNRMVMCIRAGAGSLVGLPAIIGNEPYSMTAAPCIGAEIREIEGAEFLQLISRNPALSMKVLKLLAAQVRVARKFYLDSIS